MFRLKIVQAFHGDCLILERSSQDQTYHLLMDGGPSDVYKKHLKASWWAYATRAAPSTWRCSAMWMTIMSTVCWTYCRTWSSSEKGAAGDDNDPRAVAQLL